MLLVCPLGTGVCFMWRALSLGFVCYIPTGLAESWGGHLRTYSTCRWGPKAPCPWKEVWQGLKPGWWIILLTSESHTKQKLCTQNFFFYLDKNMYTNHQDFISHWSHYELQSTDLVLSGVVSSTVSQFRSGLRALTPAGITHFNKSVNTWNWKLSQYQRTFVLLNWIKNKWLSGCNSSSIRMCIDHICSQQFKVEIDFPLPSVSKW